MGYRNTSLHTGHRYFSAKGNMKIALIFSLECSWLGDVELLDWPLGDRDAIGLFAPPALNSCKNGTLCYMIMRLSVLHQMRSTKFTYAALSRTQISYDQNEITLIASKTIKCTWHRRRSKPRAVTSYPSRLSHHRVVTLYCTFNSFNSWIYWLWIKLLLLLWANRYFPQRLN